MNSFLKTIGYRSAKSDGLVLNWLLKISGAAALAIGLIALFVLWNIHWNPQTKRDSAKLDSLLFSRTIDAIEFESPWNTNTVTGAEAQKLVASLDKANRIDWRDWTKQQIQGVRLKSGSNEVCWLSLGDDGTWKFGTYAFQVRR